MRILALTGISAALVAGLHLDPSIALAEGDDSSSAMAAAESSTDDSGEAPKTWMDEWLPSVRVGGSFSYGYDFNDPTNNKSNAALGLYSSFDSPGFNVDLIQAELSGFRKFAGYSLKVDFGDLARVAGDSGNRDRDLLFTDPSGDWEVALQEGFIYTDLSPFVVTLGRFASPIGYEVLEPWGNANITRSRAWLEQPISFDGLSVAWRAYNVDFSVAAVNSLFRDDEYNQFHDYCRQIPRPVDARDCGPGDVSFGKLVDESDDQWGAVFGMATKVYDTEISFAGFWSEVDDAVDSGLAKAFSTSPTDKVLLNMVVARSFGPVTTALEGNFAYLDKTEKAVFQDEKQFLDPISIDSSTTGNAALYVGMTFLEKGSINFRTDYGVFSDSFREREADQWSVTSTLGWQFNEYIGFRVEHRYDGCNADLRDLFAKDDGDFDDAVNTVHAQLMMTAKPL